MYFLYIDWFVLILCKIDNLFVLFIVFFVVLVLFCVEVNFDDKGFLLYVVLVDDKFDFND